MKKIFLFFVLLMLALPAFPEMAIKGTILDSGNQTPLQFVNVVVFKQGSKTTSAGVTSDKDGVFFIPALENGKYILRLSFIGYKTLEQTIDVTSKNMNIGVLKLDQNAENLKGVEVVGQASQMHFDVDKKVFDVAQNISAAGGSASDVLKNIPSVTVDNQGNIALRNDGNVQVWINGKASGLTADNRAQVLQQMPAENIQSIEIMDNPSAKYSPEGSAGIINIVLKQNHKAGYYGSVSAGIMYPDGGKIGENLGASINYTSSKVDAYANLGYRAMSFQGGGTTNRNNFNGNDTTLLNSTSKLNTSFSGLFVRAGVDYHLNPKNTLSLSGFGMVGSGVQSNNINYLLSNDMLNSKSILRDYSQINSSTGDRPSLNVDLGYHHDFNKKGSNIIADVSYSSHKRDGNSVYVINDHVNHADTSNISQGILGEHSELEFKVDYTNKLTESSKLEAGWQTDFSNYLSGTNGFDNIKNSEIYSYFNRFNYNEQIHAGYLTYGNKFGNFNFQLGLRGELFWKQYSDTIKNGTGNRSMQLSQPQSFFHLFPSFFVSYTLPKNGELQFNYTNRVNRARGRQINPFRDYSDSTNISFGNPDLLPQYSSALELNYIQTWGAQTLSTSLYTHLTDNVVQGVHFLYNGVMQSTYLNVTKSQNTGLELISKNRLFRFLDLTSTLNMYYSKLDSSTYVYKYNGSEIAIPIPGQTNFSWTANIMANFMLSKTFSGQITAEYASPQLIAQGTTNAAYSIDFGVRQSLLDRKLNISLNVRDLLNSDHNFQTTSGTGFKQTTSNYFHGRMAMLTVSYNFGNMKPKMGEMKKQQQGNSSTDMMDNGD
jgi:outer membrane receptor protein involved in Fe transport